MDFETQTPLEAAVWKLDLLELMKKHGLVSVDAEVEFLDAPEGTRLVAFAQELFNRGADLGQPR